MARKSPGSAPVTLKTIADTLGVSVTTVARALKNGEKISPEMIQKLRKTADELGYVRNMDGVKLRTGKTFVVMAFLSFSNEEEVGDAGSVGLLNGIHQRFSGTDYAVRAVPVTFGETGLDKLRQVVTGRNADGIILDHTEPQDARVKYLLEQNIPFITFGRTELSPAHPYFDIDNEETAYQGTKSLIDQGYRRIAMLDADPRYSFVSQRVIGYHRALSEACLAADPTLMRHIDLRANVAKAAAAELVDGGADAIVCVNELVFLGARAGVHQVLGPKAKTIGFSLRSGTNLGDYVSAPVNTSYFSRLEAGCNLADLLLKRIDGASVDACQSIGTTELRLNQGLRD